MKKMRVGITEKLIFNREIVIEIPDNMSIAAFDLLLDKAQAHAISSGNLPSVLEKLNQNVYVTHSPDQDFSSPFASEFVIEEFEELA